MSAPTTTTRITRPAARAGRTRAWLTRLPRPAATGRTGALAAPSGLPTKDETGWTSLQPCPATGQAAKRPP